jgi:heme exporter protein A
MGDAMADVIEAESVSKTFGRTRVLRDLTLRVAAGEVVAVFGANGAGKSTLLRMCASLQRPTAGTLRVFGGAPSAAAVRRRIGLVAHASMLYPDLGARENLEFYAQLYAIADPQHTVATWLQRIGLVDVAERPVRALSRGMEQRLALARALLHAPDLLILDEPWTGLDAAASDLLDALLREQRAARRTVLVATHDLARGLALADRALVLHHGRVEWETRVSADSLAAVDAVYRRVTNAVAA